MFANEVSALASRMDKLTDLVRDWRLDTTVQNKCVVHVRHVSDRSRGIWRHPTEEMWETEAMLTRAE